MRLTQKELDLIDKFISNRPGTLGLLQSKLADAFFEPLSNEELRLWNCEDESSEVNVLDIWTFMFPKKKRTFTVKAQYKGRKKPLSYVLDEEKEDD